MKTKKLTVTFLGTGTSIGVPVVSCKCKTCTSDDSRDKRLRSSVCINILNQNIIIDCTPDFRQQLLRANIDDITAILLTHHHYDHIGGFDDIRAFNFIKGIIVPIYGRAETLNALKSSFDYAFDENSEYKDFPHSSLHSFENEKIFTINSIEILPIRIWHSKMEATGFRIANFAYITDASFIEESQLEKLKNLDVLVLNALRHKHHPAHFTLEEALKVAESLKARQTFFTHISHHLGLHQEVEKLLPENIRLAYDGLTIEINAE